MTEVFVFDPTASDKLSKVRGVGRYLQLLKENFPGWSFTNKVTRYQSNKVTFINPFLNFLQPPLVMQRVAKKQIAVIHDLIPLKYPEHFPAGIKGRINIFLNKLALKNYDLVVTDSAASKKDIVQILKMAESRVKVIYPCLTKGFLKVRKEKLGMETRFPLPNLPSNFCLYVGDATWNKNLVNLAKAIKIADIQCIFAGKVFEVLKKESEDTCFEQIAWAPARGEGEAGEKHGIELSLANNYWLKEFNEFKELVKDDKRFIFTGYLDDYKLVKLYQQAQLNILISRDEGFGFSYLEAAQFGCPSVLSDIPVLKEISNNQGAIFVHPDNPEDIADKLKKVFYNDKLRNKLSLEAQQQARMFSPERFKKDWLLNIK